MTYCAEFCLEIPDSFPVVELAAFMAEARRVLIPEKTEKTGTDHVFFVGIRCLSLITRSAY
jgi:hypothetical protein